MTGTPDIPRLDVTVGTAPVPGLLRPSIEAALTGRALDGGPEAALGRAVADAVGQVKGEAG
jgi:hypothetical protein